MSTVPSDTKYLSYNLVTAILPSEIGNMYRTLGVEIVTLLSVPLVSTLPAARFSVLTFSRRGRPSNVSLAGAVDVRSSCGSSSIGLEARGGGGRGGVASLVGVLKTKV
jgi:hypothetical protein